jgi:hypothetical protein
MPQPKANGHQQEEGYLVLHKPELQAESNVRLGLWNIWVHRTTFSHLHHVLLTPDLS